MNGIWPPALMLLGTFYNEHSDAACSLFNVCNALKEINSPVVNSNSLISCLIFARILRLRFVSSVPFRTTFNFFQVCPRRNTCAIILNHSSRSYKNHLIKFLYLQRKKSHTLSVFFYVFTTWGKTLPENK